MWFGNKSVICVTPSPLIEGRTSPRAHRDCYSSLQVAEKENHTGKGEVEAGGCFRKVILWQSNAYSAQFWNKVAGKKLVSAETDVGPEQHLMLRCSWARKIKRIISINIGCWMCIRAGEECNMEEPKLIQWPGFGGMAPGSSRSCLSFNLVEYPWGGARTLHSGEGRSCMTSGMACKIRQIREKAVLRFWGWLWSLYLSISWLFPRVEGLVPLVHCLLILTTYSFSAANILLFLRKW